MEHRISDKQKPSAIFLRMVRLTRKLIRKKAEHHEGILPELEEISLHQLEIEKIDVIGDVCRKLKILYLQNNIISKIENLHHCKDMEYLNLALNNIERIEGLKTMEFLNKLDLTVNFIDCDTFEESIGNLRYNRALKELYLMGNPATDWDGHRPFVINVLPQLEELDGKCITKTERIKAAQKMPQLLKELRCLANDVKMQKMVKLKEPYDEEVYSTRSRLEMYREIAEEKQVDEDRKKQMQPRDRNYKSEHHMTIKEQRAKERELGTAIRQCNEGKYSFRMIEEDGKGNIILEIDIPKYIDTSLVDVDVQPTYVSIIVKNKTTRLTFPEEIKPDDGTAKRAQICGTLKLTLPKLEPLKGMKGYRIQKNKERSFSVNLPSELVNQKRSEKVGREMLEVAKTVGKRELDIVPAVKEGSKLTTKATFSYVDDSDVPPIE